MNFSPFHDDIFTANHASALDIIGSSSCHMFKDTQASCFDQFQNLCGNVSYPTTADPNVRHSNITNPFADNTVTSLTEDDILLGSKPFSWCTDEPTQSFSPIYSYSGIPVEDDYNEYCTIIPQCTNNFHVEDNAASAVAQVQDNPLSETYLTGLQDHSFSVPTDNVDENPPPDLPEPDLSNPVRVITPGSLSTDPPITSPTAQSTSPPHDPPVPTRGSNVDKPVSPQEDLLSKLTEEIFSSSKRAPSSRNCILQSVYEESEQTMELDGSQFLAPIPETAPAIPSLPESLASKFKSDQRNCVTKFKTAYRRTTSRKFQGSYLDLIAGEDIETRPSSNTRFARQQKQCLLDTIDDYYQSGEVKSQQINVAVYRRIKTCNEMDLEKGNFSGYVVADTSCFEGCKPFNGHPQQSNSDDEINIGTLASCKRLGAVRRVCTPSGASVVIISPRLKYQIARSRTPKRASTPKRVKVDDAEKMTCNTCTKKFRTSKLLFSHILQWHTPNKSATWRP